MMQYLGHAETLVTRAVPINCMRLTLTGNQPELEAVFRSRFHKLDENGHIVMENVSPRLVDRRPVLMIKSKSKYVTPPKLKSSEKREGYSNPGLTIIQNACMTKYTREGHGGG